MANTRKSTGPKKRIKLGGKNFTHQSCSDKKTAANKQAESLRKKGFTARVVTTGKKHCVYKGAKSKNTRRKRK